MFGFLKKLMGMPNDEVLQQYKEKGAVIIDVRTPAEYKGGHPKRLKIFLCKIYKEKQIRLKK
ncbi:MAG: rhodanese-like domain-containing protein [Chitinophagales bacterium]